MKKNKAFTLVELLAVIIILGLLAIIIIPKTQKTISDSKKNTYEVSANSLSNEATSYFLAQKAKTSEFNECEYDFTNNNNTCMGFDFKGKKPDSGILKIDNRGNVKFAVKFGDYCYKKIKSSSEIITNEYDVETCTLNSFKLVSDTDNNGIISTGDEYETNGENFYVVNINESTNDIVLLAKYNLYVGSSLLGYSYSNLDETSELYGKQSKEAKGWLGTYSSTPSIGVLGFSRTNYWENKVGIGDYQYQGSYSSLDYPYVYDNNYNEQSPSNNYSIAYYVQPYKEYLEEQGIAIKEARLLTYQEVIEIFGCNASTGNCTSISDEKKFVYSTKYYLGNAASDTTVYFMNTTGSISTVHYTSALYGARPVIVVSKDEF